MNQIDSHLTFRWLGTAGIELTYGNHTLLVDPFLTRPSLVKVLLNQPLQSDAELLKKHLKRAQWVLVSHAHYDHLMDVATILRLHDSTAFGSPNTCKILHCSGVPGPQVQVIQAGDQLDLGPFQIKVLPCWHTRTPVDLLIQGKLSQDLRPPLRPLDYKMDMDFSFQVQVGGCRLMIGNEPGEPLDFLYTTPFCPTDRLAQIIQQGLPKVIFLIHWENFTLPINQALVPLPIRSASCKRFQQRVHEISPQIEVKVLDILSTYSCSGD